MAGFGLASAANVDTLNNPSYVSSSGHDRHTSLSGHFSSTHSEGPTSLLTAAHSFGSERTTRERQQSSQCSQVNTLSTASERGDVRPDGVSDIMSTLGSAFHDRTCSRQSPVTINIMHGFGQTTWYHNLSDVEEVLTAVADKAVSLCSQMR